MAYFALLWKARAIEKYRINYEKEKINSILQQNPEMPRRTLYEKWSHYKYNAKKRMAKSLRRCFPEGSKFLNFVIYLQTDQTFPNFVWKSVLGFVGGIVLTYLCFMFFVFQLAISLIHATIMSSIIGVLLTLGLAFSYRARCLVFLLIPQFFSRVGRYTLTCYALVLILTGPATNTLKNSEVLSESMACSQEQIKTSVRQIKESAEKPFNSMKDTIKIMIDKIRQLALTMKETFLRIHTLGMHIVSVFQNSLSWLNSIIGVCNKKLGTPYARCNKAIEDGVKACKAKFGDSMAWSCHPAQIGHAVCETFKPLKFVCAGVDYLKGSVIDTCKRKLQSYSEHIATMLFISIHVHHSYSFSSNSSRSASQVAAGIVTEIRGKADPMLTWISWSSCVTSAFLLLIIFRAKHYQGMFETRSRFDNRYVNKELRDLDLKRLRQGRETVLPLNGRERAKYVTTTSFRLVASEKLYLTRSAVFTAITTFKLLIHMVADYSLYWVLMTIRYHGRFQSPLKPESADEVVKVLGEGAVASILRAIIGALSVPLNSPMPDPITCLPDPYPPDFQRYAQIGVLILLLWFFALLEPYGLRLRHIIMSLYSPARAKARAGWLYNHILRTRGSFLKYARRKLHRTYKYSGDEKLTFRYWVDSHIPFTCLRYLLGNQQGYPQCVLCGVTNQDDPKVELTRCGTLNCPGLYCSICFNDIGQLCTICLSPVDYGDLSDVSLEKGSSESSDDSDEDSINDTAIRIDVQGASPSTLEADDSDSSLPKYLNRTRSMWFSTSKNKEKSQEVIELLIDHKKSKASNESTPSMLQRELKKVIKKKLTQNGNGKPTTIIKKLTHYTNPKSKTKDFNFKIRNNPMVYTALVSYDNLTQPNKKGFCENRAKINEALEELSTRRHCANTCKHTSVWLRYNTKRSNSRPRKRNINLISLQFKNSRKKRIRPARDLTAFMSNFYQIQRKGISFSIAKICSTSKIGKILRRKFKVIRRRRVREKSARRTFHRMFSGIKNYRKLTTDKIKIQIQEESDELTEIIVTTPCNSTDQATTQKPTNRKRNNEKRHNQQLRNQHCSIKSYTHSTESTNNHDKTRGMFSEYFNMNLINPVAMFFNQTNNAPPVLENKTNYKRRKKVKKSLTEFLRIKRKSKTRSRLSAFLDDSECMQNMIDEADMTSENSEQSTSKLMGTSEKDVTNSTSGFSMKLVSNNKPLSFKTSILSVKKYCSNFAHGRKNKSATKNSEEKGITIKPVSQSATTQYVEAGRFCTTKEETCYCDAKVWAANETCSCGVQYSWPNQSSNTETTSHTGISFNSSTETLKRLSANSRDTVTYECEDPPSVDFSSYSLIKKKKHNVELDNKSTETVSTVTANATTVINDWWSPILDERKKIIKSRPLEKKSSGDHLRVTAKRKSRNIAKMNFKNSLASTDTKLVSFRSKADIIPSGFFSAKGLTPSRYLEEKQSGNPKHVKMKRLTWQAARH